ncbi:MAG: glycoside hydrolase family 78 protein [Tannerella sp.]|jgi:alpha-L-rhamnosidase|nr:glycoside hydrolase family 78 protein [Tannerella sp.]
MKRKTNEAKRQMLLFVLSVALFCSCTKFSIENLRCDYLVCPTGLDNSRPRFSWMIVSEERNVSQSAYRIVVTDKENKNDLYWDSGWHTSNETFQIVYEGKELESDHSYVWQVSAQINGKEVYSKSTEFHTGLLDRSMWNASWITANEEVIHASPLLRTEFAIKKTVKSAWMYTAAAGFYEVYLNGQRAGEDRLNPSITDYRKTVLYSVYDVNKLLKKGNNALGTMLGNSASNMRRKRGRYSWNADSHIYPPCFSMQMRIVYTDGSDTLIRTDNQWKYAFGPITYNNIYGGEDCDARLEQDGWSSDSFDDTKWKQVAAIQPPSGVMRWQSVPIQVTETLKPVTVTHPSKGVYLYDLGQNIVGWWRLELKGTAGQTVRIRGSETLNNDLFPKNMEQGDTLNMGLPYHAMVWTDYTLKSNETETYEPHFFYTGFRYIEVNTDVELASLKVSGRVVRSAIARAGEWSSSNELLNRIHKAGLWAQMGNTVGYPTDCPHREKGAYNGDGQVVAEASMYDFQMAPFYWKWLNDMRDSQESNGRIPNTSPPIVGGTGGGIGWGSAYVLIPWWMYRYYGDTEILREHYPAMKRYMDYLRTLARTDEHPEEPYIINFFDGYWYSLGEWMSPDRSDCPNHAVVNTFYYSYNARLMSRIAAVLGHTEDSKQYQALSDTVKQAFNEKFFSPETLLYGSDSTYQTYQLLALAGDLVPEGCRSGVLQTVADDIRKRNNHLNTGIIGTKYLWSILSDAGMNELVYKVATQETYPSFGYWINNNSTTLLEDWKGQNSHNHQMFGSVTEYFYQYLAGIRPPSDDETAIGYKHIVLSPCMPVGLNHVKASLWTLAGKITSGWERAGSESYHYEVSLPANTTATVLLPTEGQVILKENGKLAWHQGVPTEHISGIRLIKEEKSHLLLHLGSGSYRFTVEKEQAALK